jgi:O-antigen/teichoic acid export membrane protein
MKMVRNLLTTSIYYCISGQLTIWIISLFGTTDAVAQVGALSRFSAAITVLQSIATTLLVPRFSRMSGDFRSNLGKFIGIELILIALGFTIIGTCALVPGPLLRILGDGYEGLTTGLLLAVSGGCMQFVSVTTHQLLASRGMVVPAKWFIPLTIVSQCVIIWFLRPHDLTSVLWLNLFTIASVYLIRIGYLTKELNKA